MPNPQPADITSAECCTECKRLGSEYETAVKSYLKILAETDKALGGQNNARLHELESLVVQTSDRLNTARSALKQHLEIHLKSGEVSSPD